MAIADDFTIDYTAKTVTHSAGTTVYTVLEFFQWLAQTFATSAQMDDDYAFVSDTPTVYRWVNGWAFGTPSTDYQFFSGGAITSSDGDELWSNVYSIGAQEAGTDIYIVQNGTVLTSWWASGNIDVLVNVKTGGVLIDSGNVLVMAREFGDEYDHNFADLSGGGRTPVGINTGADISNTTAEATVATYNDISITFGSVSKDLNNGSGLKPYDVVIDGAGRPITEVYEYLKYVTRKGETDLLDGVEGQQYRSANTATYTDVKKSPFGTIAGGTIYGARGVWIENTLTSEYSLTDANGDLQNPPNYQKVAVSNAQLDGCNIFVAETSGGVVIKDQYTIDSVTTTTIDVTTTVDINKTPQSGGLRVGDIQFTFTGFSGVQFTGVSPDPTGFSGDLYVPLMDITASGTSALSDAIIYSSDITLTTVVRKYGFKPYSAPATFGSNGLTFSPILTDDPQAT